MRAKQWLAVAFIFCLSLCAACRAAEVSVALTDAQSGEPIAGAQVAFVSAGAWRAATADTQGLARAAQLAPGLVWFAAYAPGYRCALARTFLSGPEAKAKISVPLQRVGFSAVAGRALLPQGQAPAQGATLILQRDPLAALAQAAAAQEGAGRTERFSATADAQGRFRFARVPVGQFRLLYVLPGEAPAQERPWRTVRVGPAERTELGDVVLAPPPASEQRAEERPNPVLQAQAALQRCVEVKDFAQLADALTNESAAALSFGAMIVAATITAFSEDQQMQADLERVVKELGVNIAGGPSGAQGLDVLKANGRNVLRELGLFIQRWAKGQNSFTLNYNGPRELEKLTYVELGPQRVRIIGGALAVEGQPIEARIEDGAWRIHLGDFEAILRAMKKQGQKPPP